MLFLVLFALHFHSISCLFLSSKILCNHNESLALIHFKRSFSINTSASEYNPYPKTETWKEDTDCCMWDGVKCDIETGYVIELNLSSSMLYGPFHSNNSLFFLAHLQKLDLSDNNFTRSRISPMFGKFLSLTHLNLNFSGFKGDVPSEISQLSNLVSLDLSSNNLSIEPNTFSKIAQNLTKLKELTLNGIDMSLASPMYLMNLSSLSSLRLAGCHLRGEFPEYLPYLISLDLSDNFNLVLKTFSFFNKLEELDLSGVNMSFVSPADSFMNLSSSLSSLRLQYCGLRGKFPGTVLQLPNLQRLNLIGNRNLTGFLPPMFNWSNSLRSLVLSDTEIPIYLRPDFIGNFKSLEELYLSSCNFVGSNLALLGNLTQLVVLDLSYNNFNGQISSRFGNLIRLRLLYLSNNRFTGPIPSQLGKLSSLTLVDLSSNLLSESIPFSLFTLPSLRYLCLNNNLLAGQIGQFHHNSSLVYINLSNNKLHGPIPSSIFKLAELKSLILSSNYKLIGKLSSGICKLQHLQLLDLSNNSFSGSFPKCLGNFSRSLEVLHLGLNYFSGTIPPTFSKGNSLRYMNFHGNELHGKIPLSIINCRNLQLLDLGDNKITTTFPFFLGALPQLKVLVLRSNKLLGSVTSFSLEFSFPELQIFDLSNNNFSGPLPSEYFDHLKAMMTMNSAPQIRYLGGPLVGGQIGDFDYSVELTIKGLEIQLVKIQAILVSIDLSQNKFTGEIPKSIAELKALINLNLSHNCLTSNIQPLLGSLINLESLDLSSNFLVGRIPEQMVDLKFLQVFRVSYNQLEGLIPIGNQFNTFDSSSYEGNLGLCGFPLKKECKNGKTQQQNPPNEENSSSENGFGWRSVLVGYGCGVIFGLIIGYIIFRIKKPSWFVRMVEAEGYLWQKKLDKFKNT